MKVSLELNGQWFRADLSKGRSIAILMNFGGSQPNLFGAPAAQATTVEAGEFIGDTQRGGSCNVRQLTMIPHCNGTHTESVSHIINQQVPAGEMALESWFLADLLSITPEPADNCGETYRPRMETGDQVITRAALSRTGGETGPGIATALIVRTLPNPASRQSVTYGTDHFPPYFTSEAMNWIVDRGFEHLLVDLPSVDRMYDDGYLTNHHLFWNVPQGSRQAGSATRHRRTITELIYVDDSIVDGRYLLNLQLAALATDAVPSRPVLFPLDPLDPREPSPE